MKRFILGAACAFVIAMAVGVAAMSSAAGSDAPMQRSYHEPAPVPTTKAQCKKGGWRSLSNGTTVFKNQGQCVRFVAKNAKKPARR